MSARSQARTAKDDVYEGSAPASAERSLAPARIYQEDPGFILNYVDSVLNKQVISCAEGSRLGKAGTPIVDIGSMTLEAIALLDAPRSVATAVPLDDLTQIGDVVLVNNVNAMRPAPTRRDYVKFFSLQVRDRSGIYLGKLRDIEFNPDTGAVTSVYYDQFGLDFLKLDWVDIFGVDVQGILRVTPEEVVVDRRYIYPAQKGKANLIGKLLVSIKSAVGTGDMAKGALVDARKAAAVREWEQRYGITAEEWAARYGDDARRRRVMEPNARAARSLLPPQSYSSVDPRAARPRPRETTRQREYAAPQGPDGMGFQKERPAMGDVLEQDNRELEYETNESPPSRRAARGTAPYSNVRDEYERQ